ncbi:MAG: hypothetical protein NWQ23_13485 [Yoonia sp.]|uniref:hypothetical protein n=1 Tax=Yoonia sp. TaxID=2212373 RepID=UPI00273F5EC7|nr:hypothetical protein [Yoonia sp.]MDP5086428.1 hypothetical protein [Yoonia sp.]
MLRRFAFAACAVFGFSSAAIACPDFNLAPQESYQATGKQLYSARTFDVVAGGNNYIWNCPNVRPGTDTGAGYFPSAPDFSFQLSGMSPYQLVVRVVSECDAALLINTASANWYYDDDDNGNLDPRIVLTRPADGRVDIWIGTYDGDFCNARLEMETFDR